MLHSAAGEAMGKSLSMGISGSNDPQTVADALPAYLVLLDGQLAQNRENVALLLSGSQLNGLYAGQFVKEPPRRQLLSQKAFDFAKLAACYQWHQCELQKLPFLRFSELIEKQDDIDLLYTLGSSWAGWIETNSGDWNAIAELPRVKAIMQRVVALDERYQHGNGYLYLAVLETLVPPAMGGDFEQAKHYFDRALAVEPNNLMIKTRYAKHYARGLFDQKLHDSLLNEVLAVNGHPSSLRLSNSLAQKLARELLQSANDYF